jgi:hypothetical protein
MRRSLKNLVMISVLLSLPVLCGAQEELSCGSGDAGHTAEAYCTAYNVDPLVNSSVLTLFIKLRGDTVNYNSCYTNGWPKALSDTLPTWAD